MTDDGWFVRVRDIDHPSGTVYCTNERGGVSWFTPGVGGTTDWEPGDVAFMTNISVMRVDSSFWNAGNSVGEVTHASETDVVIKVDNQSRSFPQRASDPYAIGQLVEFVPGAGPGKVLGEHDDDFSLSRRLDDFSIESLITKPSDNDVTMDQVGGADHLKRRAVNLVKVALSPENRLKALGVKRIKGILFSGPSGTGKTFLAKALASVTEAAFYNISGPVIAGELVGQSERRLRDIFDHAESNRPAILFFDEIDSLYSQRGDGSNEHSNRLVGQFLSLLDGHKPFEQVIVIATTNLPTALDDALLRPGRLGHKLLFNFPGTADRFQIMQAQTKDMKFMPGHEPPLDDLAHRTSRWTAADLGHIWTEAGILAALDGRDRMCLEDVYAALPLVDRGPHRAQFRKGHDDELA
jgi:transitional endoplasmic reticulum ATPase